ncbi:MAG: response regulator [Burkholderiaceae bacterium]
MHRILIVEDSPDLAELAILALADRVGIDAIHHAADGTSAGDWLLGRGIHESRRSASPPQWILLDVNLPDVSGKELLRIIRENEATRYVPVVMFSSSTRPEDIIDCLRAGANSYIAKPLRFDDYAAKLRAAHDYWTGVHCSPA